MQPNLKNTLDLAHLVKSRRQTAGPGGGKMTAQALADLAGVGRDTIFRIERGEDVSFDTAMRVLRILGLVLRAEPPQWPNLHNAHDYFKVQP